MALHETVANVFLGIILGNIIATVVLLANSMAGAHYHGTYMDCLMQIPSRTSTNSALVGFPILSRAAWGMWGSQFAIWNRIFLSIGTLSVFCREKMYITNCS